MTIFPILIFCGMPYFQPSSEALECSTIAHEVERRIRKRMAGDSFTTELKTH